MFSHFQDHYSAQSFAKLLNHFCAVGDEQLGQGGSQLHQFYVRDRAAQGT
jgi:hypothetical protein